MPTWMPTRMPVAVSQSLFDEMVKGGMLPTAQQCAALIESYAARGMGAQARAVLGFIEENGLTLTVKLCCQTIAALLRSARSRAAFEIFEAHLENAGGATSTVGALRTSEWNTEHTLAILTKALAKQMDGKRAHRVYACACAAGLCNNFGAFGLPALVLACIDDSRIKQAVSWLWCG